MNHQLLNWQGKWIWDSFNHETQNYYIYFRKGFRLTQQAGSATVRVSCSGQYLLHLNGVMLGRGPNPGGHDYRYYDTYDLKPLLVLGVNALAVLCHNPGVGSHFSPAARGGFILDGSVACADGTRVELGTDRSWKFSDATPWSANTPRMNWTVGFQEIYDAEIADPAWVESIYNDDGWASAIEDQSERAFPVAKLIPREIPTLVLEDTAAVKILGAFQTLPTADPLAYGLCPNIATLMAGEIKAAMTGWALGEDGNALAILTPKTIRPPAVGIVLDFGREMVGFPYICIASSGGGIVDIGYAEALDAEGFVDPMRQGIAQADRVRLRREGTSHWQSAGRRAFRFMQLVFRVCSARVSILSAGVKRSSYPVELVGGFSCADPLLGEIYETGVHTLKACMNDHYEDCPLREHAQYVGDMRVEALVNYYAFGDRLLVAKGLRQFAREQREDGWFKTMAPAGTTHNLVDYLPLWATVLWEYYLHTGDLDLVLELYPTLKKLMGWLAGQAGPAGLIDARGHTDWWIFIDWDDIERKGVSTAFNALYHRSLAQASYLAAVAGEPEQAETWKKEAHRLREAAHRLLWCSERGLYLDAWASEERDAGPKKAGLHTNLLALVCGLATPEQEAGIWRYLLRTGGRLLTKTGYFNFNVLQALFASGRFELGLELTRKYWGGMLARGATTWWEFFDAEDPARGGECSLCHAWSAAPTYALPAWVLGVRPLAPGFTGYIVEPFLGAFEWAAGKVPTPYGAIGVEWERTKDRYRLEVLVPTEVMGRLSLKHVPAAASGTGQLHTGKNEFIVKIDKAV